MVLELAEKVASSKREASRPAPAAVSPEDVVSALVNLGYRKAEAERAVETVGRTVAPQEFGDFLKLVCSGG